MAFLPPINTDGSVVAGKADKVAGATDGNVAGLDDSGNLTDSGIAAANVVTLSSTQTLTNKTVYARLIVRTLDSLDDTGVAGEIAFYNARFYGFNGTQWKNLVPNFFDLATF